jgi:hypothetical protein
MTWDIPNISSFFILVIIGFTGVIGFFVFLGLIELAHPLL